MEGVVNGIPREKAPFWFEYFDTDTEVWIPVTGWYYDLEGRIVTSAPDGAAVRCVEADK